MINNVDKNFISLCGYYECGGQPSNPTWLKAYIDSGGVWTIGIGTIQYPNGQRVKKGDTITTEQMSEYFIYEVRNKIERVNFMTRDDITQSQFNSLVDFAYNEGTTALQKSSLLKVINNNLSDSLIINRFLDYRFDNGKEMAGLLRRRMSDAYHYFTGELRYDWKNYKTLSINTIAELKSAINAKTNCIKT